MRNVVRSVAVSILLLLGKSAMAQADVSRTWACWYGGETTVYCLLQHADPASAPVADARPTGGRPLPAIVRTLRHDPASLEDKVIVIPLHSVPFDMEFVRQLVQAVMCGALPSCTIGFGNSYANARGMVLSSRQ
jgi:hypothetical protein